MFRTASRTVLLAVACASVASGAPRAELTERGELLVDGKPFLPIFVWAQPSSAIPLHKELGVNTLHPGNTSDDDPIEGFLDKLKAADMMALVNDGSVSEALIDHPAVLAWTVEHEPDMAQPPGYTPDLSGDATYIWLEGEAAAPNTLERSAWLDKERAQLSGRKWLTTQKTDGKAVWKFKVAQAGKYQLFVREFNKNWANPTKWTLDDGQAQQTPRTLRGVDVVNFGGGQGVAWAHYGEVELTAGEHTLTFEVVPGRTAGKADAEPAEPPIFAVDAICFTTAEKHPAAKQSEPLPKRAADEGLRRHQHIKSLNKDALTWNILTSGFFGRFTKKVVG